MDGLQLALIILGIGGTIGGFAGYFAKGRADALIALLTKENDVLKDANTRLEKEAAGKDAKLLQLEAENKRLWGKAQGSDQLAKLATEIRNLPTALTKTIVEAMSKGAK